MGFSSQGRVSSQAVPIVPVSNDTVVYVGPVYDLSGYGFAARYNAVALSQKHKNFFIQDYNFSGRRIEGSDRILSLVRTHIAKDRTLMHRVPVKIIHAPPRDFAKYHSTTAYCVGCTVWETSRLTEDWVQRCNLMDEIWVPCTDNKAWFKDSGVTKPIYLVPHIVPDRPERLIAPTGFEFLANERRFVFYSVFIWQDRKNPLGTISAYLSEFTSRDKVLLVVKVANAKQAKDEVTKLIQTMGLKDPPEVRAIDGWFTDAEMGWIHQHSDCYYQLQHSEGWGLPHFEALSYGNYLITTAFGGPRDFMEKSFVDRGCCYPIGGFLTPVLQSYKYYNGRQKWLQPDVEQAQEAMREVYQIGKQKFPDVASRIRQRYSLDVVGTIMKDRVDEIVSRLS